MSYPRLAARLYNAPLVIEPQKLQTIERIFRMYEEGTPRLLVPTGEARPARPEVAPAGHAQRTAAGYTRTADGIALVSVLGTLVQRTGAMDAESGLTSYMDIGNQLAAAMADPQVHGILLEVDSMGGEVPGVFELGAAIREFGQIKPIFAHANEQALSGGYILASAANELYAPQTGHVGSIGVRMMHVDQSSYDAKRGFVYTDIFAGAHKADFSPHRPLTDAELAWAQTQVDHTYGIFVDHVARMRGIDPEQVKATEASIYHAGEGYDKGLIDGVATIGETLQLLRATVNGERSASSMRMAANAGRSLQSSAQAEIGAVIMPETPNQGTKQAPAAPAAPTAEQLAEAQARGYQEGRSEAEAIVARQREQIAADAAKAAQERVAGILMHPEAQGRRELAEHFAFQTTMGVDDVAKALAKAPKETAAARPADRLDAAMRNIGNPSVGADAPSTDDETEEQVAARILAAGKLKAVK